MEDPEQSSSHGAKRPDATQPHPYSDVWNRGLWRSFSRTRV